MEQNKKYINYEYKSGAINLFHRKEINTRGD